MGTKLDKGVYPKGHKPEDFKAFGPPALKDGEFSNCKIADLGCFTQDGKDTNKCYHAAVVQSNINKQWYTYFEWGRTGSNKPDFQFVECTDENDAQDEFESQLLSKNVKRGEWVTIAGIKTLRAKAGKDCYLVRPLATRSVGLPDGKTIKINDGNKVNTVTAPQSSSSSSVSKTVAIKLDTRVSSLLRDLNLSTLSYTKSSMADSSIPTQSSIDEARTLLTEAQKTVKKIGDDIDKQISNKDLMEITNLLYSRIPKKKNVNADASTWVLSSNNIFNWQQDLDAFEGAMQIDSSDNIESNPLNGMDLDMEWVDPSSELGKFLYHWWPNATANKHYGVGKMKIKNIWKAVKTNDPKKIKETQLDISKHYDKGYEKPPMQPDKRIDIGSNDIDLYEKSNTRLLFHGSRSQNIGPILRTGFKLPHELTGVSINGKMWGEAAYTASDWKKSAGYCSLSGSYWVNGSGGIKNRGAFMFACNVVLGKPHLPTATYGFSKPPNGYHSVWAKPKLTSLQNDEFMVYNTRQIAFNYLCEFET